MIRWLSHFLIKDYSDYNSPKVREQYGVLCGTAGIVLNVLLFAGKFLAGTLSRSIAITADAFNNLSDAGSSVIMLIGFKMSGQKPDTDHPFGHGRMEYLSGLLVAMAIIMMAAELIKSSIDKILHPTAINFNPVVIGILIASIAVKFYMYYYNHSIGKKIDSTVMQATALDSISDTFATFAVLAATLVERFTSLQISGYCGVLVGFFILWAGISAAKETIDPLLGQPADAEFVQKIEQIVMAHEEIQGIHDLVVHNYGPGRIMISLHAEVSARGDLLQLHDVIDDTERELAGKLSCEAVIHMDPVCTDDEQTNQMKQMAQACLREIGEALSLHDFRMVKGPGHTNLIFDIVVPYGFAKSDEKVVEELKEKIRSREPDCYLVVQVDHSFISPKKF